MTDEEINIWLDSWRQYRFENTDEPYKMPSVDSAFTMFYLVILGYAGLEPDEFAMKVLDEVIGEMSVEQLQSLEVYLNSFHDYMVVMGIVDI